MNLDNLPHGEHLPHDINVVIEIPSQGSPVTYEVDKDSGKLTIDCFLGTAMFYPCNDGLMSHTLADDGDPVHELEVIPVPLNRCSVIPCRPIGLLKMIDEAGEDHGALDSGQWLKVESRVGVDEAEQEILGSSQRFNSQ